jgi:hypothetical protein
LGYTSLVETGGKWVKLDHFLEKIHFGGVAQRLEQAAHNRETENRVRLFYSVNMHLCAVVTRLVSTCVLSVDRAAITSASAAMAATILPHLSSQALPMTLERSIPTGAIFLCALFSMV